MSCGIVWRCMLLPMLEDGRWARRLEGMSIDCSYHRNLHFLLCVTEDRTSKSFVKKKAALTLLRLYRKHPAILQPEWADRILSLLDDADMGVTLSVTHLVLALLQDYPEDYSGCYPKAVRRLKQVYSFLNINSHRLLSPATFNQTTFTMVLVFHGYKSVYCACCN